MTEQRTSGREFLRDRLDYDLSVVSTLMDHTQARAQSIASALGTIVALTGVVLSANSNVGERLRSEGTYGAVVWGIALLILAFVLSLLVAFPLPFQIDRPDFVEEALFAPEFRVDVDVSLANEAFADLLEVEDRQRLRHYRSVAKTAKWRGGMLAIANIVMIAGMLVLVIAGANTIPSH